MTQTETIKAGAKRVVREITAAIEDSKDNPTGWAGLKAIATEVVPRVEAIGHEFKLPGAQKKAMAIEAAMLLLRQYAPSGWLSWVPDAVLRWLIGITVETAVKRLRSLLNKIGKGKA